MDSTHRRHGRRHAQISLRNGFATCSGSIVVATAKLMIQNDLCARADETGQARRGQRGLRGIAARRQLETNRCGACKHEAPAEGFSGSPNSGGECLVDDADARRCGCRSRQRAATEERDCSTLK